jgi:penicillin amidase
MFRAFPVGKLLDPFAGAVQNGADRELRIPRLTIGHMNISDSVQVFFDDRKVPHVYARNEHDLYFAQGYVTAYLRLWQMDFLSYASAGRLSEILPNGFLEYDLNERKMGILDAAKASLELIEKDSETNAVLTAYSDGVNAYIKSLDYRKLPLEYKILDYQPEPWSKLKTALIMKYMGNTLAGYEEDYSMSNMMLALGEGDFNKLYPALTSPYSPINNDSTGEPNASFTYIKKPDYLTFSFLSSGSVIPPSTYNPRLGSNSWAVSGRKTKSGSPILCNDPHLGLSLPSIWVEMQLSAPGMNVYGVSIPGTPAVIIGFNDQIAWGLSNGADDVLDWYKLKITPDYKKYELDGKWLNLDYTVEEIKRRDQTPFLDTIYHTIPGRVVINKATDPKSATMSYALRWELQRPTNEFLTFIKLSRAKNYKDYKDAIKHYSCPTLNFTFACKDNTIAITHQGSMAIKSPGEGNFVMDGTRSSDIPTRYIPEDSLPQVLNPPSDYVFSANQRPTNAFYKYYYNGYYFEMRANRIKQLLEKGDRFDIPKMEAMQLDNVNSFAVDALPVLLRDVDKEHLTESQKKHLEGLATWNGEYSMNDVTGKLFDLWWRNIGDYTWDEFKELPFYKKAPADYVLLNLIRNEPGNIYFDKQGTSKRENAADIVREAFVDACTKYEELQKRTSVKWGDLNRVNIMHMTNIAAFSRMNIASAGHPDAINATAGSWGPSWRMIVQLGDRPKAFGIYGGGQSGNIGSSYYDNFVTDWNNGVYYPLRFFMSENEAKNQSVNTWTLK